METNVLTSGLEARVFRRLGPSWLSLVEARWRMGLKQNFFIFSWKFFPGGSWLGFGCDGGLGAPGRSDGDILVFMTDRSGSVARTHRLSTSSLRPSGGAPRAPDDHELPE